MGEGRCLVVYYTLEITIAYSHLHIKMEYTAFMRRFSQGFFNIKFFNLLRRQNNADDGDDIHKVYFSLLPLNIHGCEPLFYVC